MFIAFWHQRARLIQVYSIWNNCERQISLGGTEEIKAKRQLHPTGHRRWLEDNIKMP